MMNYCNNCGGSLHYDAKLKSNKCDACGAVFPVENVFYYDKKSFDDNFLEEESKQKSDIKLDLQCKNCGAKLMLKEFESITYCPYCGSPLPFENNKKIINVDSIIPFHLTKEQAYRKLRKAINCRLLTDKKAFKNLKIEDVVGVYANTFAFDMNVLCQYSGILQYNEKDDDNNILETKNKHVYGMIDEVYKDIVIEANHNLEQHELLSIMPFNYRSAYKFSEDFMQGYELQEQDKPFKECVAMAERFIKEDLKRIILKRHNCDESEALNMNNEYSNKKFNYCLVPIYFVNTVSKYKKNGIEQEKKIKVLINGQTGKVGSLPKNPLKLFLMLFGCCSLIVAIILLIIFVF